MESWSLIQTQHLNTYIYSERYKTFSCLPDELIEHINGRESNNGDAYYDRKFNFLKEQGYFDAVPIEFETQYDPKKIYSNIGNLRQLLIEVTDYCNLQCAYCGYGEYYNNYDKRETRLQKFSTVKTVIDSFAAIWNSDANTSHLKVVYIGFYGGEPLLNFPLIKKTIEYIESLHIPGLTFTYAMTTNGVLLHRYMDFIAMKNFSLLVSLDGDEYNSSYRVAKDGKSRFHRIVKNIHLLKDTYPEYFKESVNFNSVLHDRNSVEDAYRYIKNEFGKTSRIIQLNTNGVDEEKQEEFLRMFNSQPDSVKAAEVKEMMAEDEEYIDLDTKSFHNFIRRYAGHDYTSYSDIYFLDRRGGVFIPTATCQPFEKKIFLTVNGKLLPCEKVGHQHSLGQVTDGKLDLNYDAIADYYSHLYKKIVCRCRSCISATTCAQCVFYLIQKDGDVICPYYVPKNQKNSLMAKSIGYAENYPDKYVEVMEKIIVD